MKKANVTIGSTYIANVSDARTAVKITGVSVHGGWNATNLKTGRTVRIRTAARLTEPKAGWPSPAAYIPAAKLTFSAHPGVEITASETCLAEKMAHEFDAARTENYSAIAMVDRLCCVGVRRLSDGTRWAKLADGSRLLADDFMLVAIRPGLHGKRFFWPRRSCWGHEEDVPEGHALAMYREAVNA